MTDIFFQWHQYIFEPQRIPFALAALFIVMIVGAVMGSMAGNANPFIWLVVDKLFGSAGEKLDRTHRPRADLLFRGFLVTMLALVIMLLLGEIVHIPLEFAPYHSIAEVLSLSLLLTGGSVWFALLRLYFALEKEDVVKSGVYYAIARSTRKNLAAVDNFGITRSAMGYAVRSFDKGVVAPVIWYLIGGLPLALVYSVLAALAWRFGKDGFSKGLGIMPLALEKLLGFVPSLLAAVFINLAALFTPTAKTGKALASWWAMESKATYEQGGYPLSVMAWALNVSLGGAAQDLSGSAVKGPWVGPEGATAKNDHKHLRRALLITVTAYFLFIVSLAGAYLWGF